MPATPERKRDAEKIHAEEETFVWPPPADEIKAMVSTLDEFLKSPAEKETPGPRPVPVERVSPPPPVEPADAIQFPRPPSASAVAAFAVVAVLVIVAVIFSPWKLLRREPAPTPPPASAAAKTDPQPAAATSTVGAVDPAAKPADAAPGTRPTAGASGTVVVRTDTAGARVWIDGALRGRTPLTIGDLPAGTHVVAVEGPAGRLQQTISTVPESTANVFFATGAGASGAIAVQAPIDLEVREAGRVVGTSRADRILLEPGRHTLDLVNESLGYSTRQTVDVVPGKTASVAVQVPNGTLNINALPWAEVFLDGERLGETPIGRLAVRIGRHEVLFRHPELGEVTRTVDVTASGTTRVTVSLEKKED